MLEVTAEKMRMFVLKGVRYKK